MIALLLIANLLNATNLFAIDLPVHILSLPKGFSIAIYAYVPEARQMALGDNGTVYVGGFRNGSIYAVLNPEKKPVADEVVVINKDLRLPSGVAYRDGDLYVGAINRILRYPDIASNLRLNPEPEVVTDSLPSETHHGWKFIRFGPDGNLYIPVGAPCNVCLKENPQFGSILRMDLTTPNTPEVFASGVRNSVGFDWHPLTGELWFTDNGRDLMGDDIPPCELNHAPRKGMHFGFPYIHGDNIKDPEFGSLKHSQKFTKPAQKLGPHVAPLGMSFYTGDMFPKKYKNQIIIPEHGSWNRTSKAGPTGYRLTMVRLRNNKAVKYQPFVTGWSLKDWNWGRPVATLVLEDGSLLVSDDTAGVIYRISYNR